jgi:hypothetical protein
MLKAYAAGLGFVLRSLFTVYGIAIAFLVLEIVVILCYVAYETNAPAAGTWAAIVVLFVIQQVAVLGRVYLRVAMIGAERLFYEKARPVPAVAVVEPLQSEPIVPADPAGLEAQPTT